MRKVLRWIAVPLAAVAAISFSYAGGNEKEYKKLIYELGIDTTAMKAESVVGFWNVLWRKNERF